MDENKNEQELFGQQTDQAQEVSQPVPESSVVAEETAEVQPPVFPDGTAAAPSPKKFPLIPLVVVILVLAVAAIAAFATGIFSSPEKAVDKAFEATGKEMTKYTETLMNELPALKVLQNTEPKSTSTEFDFTFESLDLGAMATSDVTAIVDMLTGSGLRGTFVSDVETPAFELDTSVHLGDLDLLELYGFLSSELLAGNLPTFSDTVLSINPQTFAEDFKASPFYDGSDDATLQEMQNLVNAEVALLTEMSKLDSKKMSEEMLAIVRGSRQTQPMRVARRRETSRPIS